MTPEHTHALVVGAGLGGSLMAIFLADMGYRVTLVERRPDPRAKGFIGGRSINLALSTRGITALKRADLEARVLKDAIPMRGRMMHSTLSELTFQPYSANEGEAINSVSRGGLNLTLLEAASERESVTMRFGMRCEGVDLDGAVAHFTDADGQPHAISADLIIGADGAFSAVRASMQKTDRFSYSQSYLEHGYKELHIPPTSDGEFALEPNALHIWPRGGSMMIALPNADKSFTCTLFWPYAGHHSFDEVEEMKDVKAFFEQHYPDAVPVMPTLVEDYENNPTSSLVTVRCDPWITPNRKVALLGDAAHAIVPFYGQGMNASFEDARRLAELLESHDHDIAKALTEYNRERIPAANAIADMALDNFIEMRDKVGDPIFLYKKKLEKLLHKRVPGWYTPLYNLVSFSNVPYDEARERVAAKHRVIGIVLVSIALFVFLIIYAILF
ncbi:MAG: NAD(P)/FAD-dependent oxidoreductase [Phycisphaerales bacterium]